MYLTLIGSESRNGIELYLHFKMRFYTLHVGSVDGIIDGTGRLFGANLRQTKSRHEILVKLKGAQSRYFEVF